MNQLNFFNSTSLTNIERFNEQVRATSQLYKDYNLVTKLDEMKLEMYGKNNHYYKVR